MSGDMEKLRELKKMVTEARDLLEKEIQRAELLTEYREILLAGLDEEIMDFEKDSLRRLSLGKDISKMNLDYIVDQFLTGHIPHYKGEYNLNILTTRYYSIK